MFPQIGKILILVGAVTILLGLLLLLAGRVPFFGKLPGDFVIRGKSFTLYVPIVSMLIISLLLTILINIFWRGR